MDIAFGPVASRRLGRGLDLNNIPPKIRTYPCIYCQLGRTNKMSDRRREFYSPAAVVAAVEAKAREVLERGEAIDFLTFVPDGEPPSMFTWGRRSEGSVMWDRRSR